MIAPIQCMYIVHVHCTCTCTCVENLHVHVCVLYNYVFSSVDKKFSRANGVIQGEYSIQTSRGQEVS